MIVNNLYNDYGRHWVPVEGYVWVSDGTIWTTDIYLGRRDTIERWHGTNDDPPEPDVED